MFVLLILGRTNGYIV